MSDEIRTSPEGATVEPAAVPGGCDGERTETEDSSVSAQAPPRLAAAGTGETSSEDADVPVAPELATMRSERDDYLALAQRTQADFENYRKRMARENAMALDRGMAKLTKELLPALDHLELALAAAGGHEDVLKGFAMVRDELQAALGRVGIQSFSPKGEAFDPNEHEAMVSQPVEDAEPGTVIQVYQSGYRINGAVLRPARVIVAA